MSEQESNSRKLLITLRSEQSMSRHLITRVRHVIEGTTVDASSPAEAIEKARKLNRSAWSHIESKRRRAYKAEPLDVGHSGRTR